MSTPISGQGGLPAEYTSLLNDLNRTIYREKPRDVLQFCANWFNKRLEEQRTELMHHSSLDPRTFPQSFTCSCILLVFPEIATAQFLPELSCVLFLILMLDSPLPSINTRRAQTETIFEESSPFAPTSPRSAGPPPAPSSQSTTTGTTPSFLSQDPNPSADFPPNYNLSRRTSVSAESLAPQTSSPRRTSGNPAKTAQQESRIRAAISANLLFKNLDDEQTRDVLDSMTEKRIPKDGVVVIHQGDVGDFFYVVEEGNFDFYIRKGGNQQGLGDKVGNVGPGGSFGELALMYNAPRAASVVSTSPGVLWALDRITFRKILMDVMSPFFFVTSSFLNHLILILLPQLPCLSILDPSLLLFPL